MSEVRTKKLRIVVTRSEDKAEEFMALLQGIDTEPLLLSTIAFEDPEDWTPVDEVLSRLDTFDWTVFTSGTAVSRFLQRAEQLEVLDRIKKVRIAAVGSATAQALEERGVEVLLTPAAFTSSVLLSELGPYVIERRVLLPRGDLADSALPSALADMGAAVTEVIVYRTVPPPDLPKRARQLLDEGVDLVCFTSASAIKNLLAALGKEASRLRDVPVAVIGPATASAAGAAGLDIAVRAGQSTIPGLVDAIRQWKEERNGD